MPWSISQQEMNKTWLLSTPTAACQSALQAAAREVAPVPRSPAPILPQAAKPHAELTSEKLQVPGLPRGRCRGGGGGATDFGLAGAAGPPQGRTETLQQAPRGELTSAPPQLSTSTDLDPRTSTSAPTQGTAEAPVLALPRPGHSQPIATSQIAQNSRVEALLENVRRPPTFFISEKSDWEGFTFIVMCGSLDLPAGSILSDSKHG
jgi:hypothetical protein